MIFKKAIQSKIFCAVDLGCNNFKSAVMREDGKKELELLGVYETPLVGFKNCSVTNLEEFSDCLQKAIGELGKRSQVAIKTVQLGLSGGLIETREVKAAIPLIERGSKVIAARDVKKINHQARLLGLKLDEEVLHELPQYYRVDDINIALNPVGLFGRKLEMASLMVIANTNKIQNVVLAFSQGGYDVENIFFSSLAGADVVVSDDDKFHGVGVVDIGAKGTSVAVYKDRILKYLGKISFGADQFTANIAEHLQLSGNFAEEIKKMYADVSAAHQYSQEEVLVKKESIYHPIKREMIFQAIEPLVVKLLQELSDLLQSTKMLPELNRGIIVMGGGSLLSGLIERIEDHLKLPTRMGKIQLPLQKALTQSALFAPVVGVAKAGYVKSIKKRLLSEDNANWRVSVLNRMRELYQEYF